MQSDFEINSLIENKFSERYKNYHAGRRERVRERFIREGLDSFAEHEVLELLLFYSIPQRDTNLLAHKMISEYGTLANLMEAHPSEVINRFNVSLQTATLISLIPSISRIYQKSKSGEKALLDSSTKAGEYVKSLFIGYSYEVFQMICLDSRNRVNYASVIQEGTINEAAVYPRIVVETALRHQSVSVIIAHNHPGGSTQPSTSDINVTKKIKMALEAISIRLIDHIIVTGDTFISLAEKSLI